MGRGVVVALTLSGAALATTAVALVFLRTRKTNHKTANVIILKGASELEQALADPQQRERVTRAELHHARFTAMALQQLASLTNLVHLDLGSCGLTQLPSGIGSLKRLQVLLAPSNHLTDVPAELGRLSGSLTQLDLGGNKLTEVPSALLKLTGLRVLNLMGNQLERLPDDFGRLRNLRLLGLKSNKLVELPASFSQLTGLVELFITDNKLTDLPQGMSSCTSLVKLQASFNAFTSLPACLLHLPRLELLRVAVCAIASLPDRLLEGGALPRLAWFSVAGNPVCPDPPPREAGLPEVEEDELELGQKLGDGASGEVYRAIWKGDLVAVKFFRADVSPDGRTEDEVALAISLQHPHLTQVLAKVKYPPGLVLRLVTGTPLALKPTSQHLLRCKWGGDVSFALRRALRLAAAVADALRHCHELGICHGDVYAHNVLMDEDENVTLCDFGASFSYDRRGQPFWEPMEVRAYGLMVRDVVQRCDCSGSSGSGGGSQGGLQAEVAGALAALAERCTELPPASRPSFANVCVELGALEEKLRAGAGGPQC